MQCADVDESEKEQTEEGGKEEEGNVGNCFVLSVCAAYLSAVQLAGALDKRDAGGRQCRMAGTGTYTLHAHVRLNK